MAEFLETLFKWQTLIGSIMGGLFALFAALIVASYVRRREEVASAMLVLSNLISVRITSEAITYVANETEEIPVEDYPLWLSDRLVKSHPSLSMLFESSVAQIMPVDACMAAHLSLFHRTYSAIEIILERLYKDFEHFREHRKPLRPIEQFRADADIVNHHLKRAVRHASCAELLISKLILSRVSTWHRLIRHIRMNKEEKKCLRVLKEGRS